MDEPKMVPLIYCFGRRVDFPGMDASRFEVRRFPFEASAQACDQGRIDGEWLWDLRWAGGAELSRGTAKDGTEAGVFINVTAGMFLWELWSWFRELDAEEKREAERERGLEIQLGPFVHAR